MANVRNGSAAVIVFLTCLGAAPACSPPAEPELVEVRQQALTAPDWRLGQNYRVGDLVTYQGIVYQCRQAHTSRVGQEPAVALALWMRPQPADLLPWTANTQYGLGSDVTHNGLLYEAIQAHVSQTDWPPTRATTLWRCASASCQTGAPCLNRPNNSLCDDGLACTTDVCQSGRCLGTRTCGAEAFDIDFTITLPAGLDVRRVAVHGSSSVRVSGTGQVRGAATVNMGSGTTEVLTGGTVDDLYSVGAVTLTGANVAGSVFAEGAVSRSGGSLAGKIVAPLPLGRVPGPRILARFPSVSQPALQVASGITRDLTPGFFERVDVAAGGRVRLTSGRYYFTTLRLNAATAVLEVDDSRGPVEIFVASVLELRGPVATSSTSGNRVLFVLLGANAPVLHAPLLGSLIAPNATLTLEDRLPAGGNHTYQGTYFGKTVVVATGVSVRATPNPSVGSVPQVATPAAPGGALEPVPGYDPGLLVCQAGLTLGPVQVDPVQGEYRAGISLSPAPNPVPGPNCRLAFSLCDEEGQPLPPVSEAELNSAQPAASVCPAIRASAGCPVDPASLGGACASERDCALGEICATVCATTGCIQSQRRCGRLKASCEEARAESDFCDARVFRECPQGASQGTVTADSLARQLPLQEAAQDTTKVTEAEKVKPKAFHNLENPHQDFCVPPELEKQDVSQEKAGSTNEGDKTFGLFVEPVFDQLMRAKWDDIKEGDVEVGGRAGVAFGGYVFGYKVTPLEIFFDMTLNDCNSKDKGPLSAGFTVKVFGDAVSWWEVLGDSGDGPGDLDPSGFPSVTVARDKLETRPGVKEECARKFDERNLKAGNLRQSIYGARHLKEFYGQFGANKDLCTRTNRELGTTFDCANLPVDPSDPNRATEQTKIVNAWIDQYDEKVKEYRETKTAFKTLQDGLAGSVAFNFFRLGDGGPLTKPYALEWNVPGIPIGPVQLVLAISAFGEWYLDGGMQLGWAYDDNPLTVRSIGTVAGVAAGTHILGGQGMGTSAAVGALAGILTAPGDFRLIAGPVFTPGASLTVSAFAGVGFPGVSAGVEGSVSILSLSLPIEGRVSAIRKREPDTRDVASSDFAGPPIQGFSILTENMNYGWAYGSRLQLSALDGRLDAAVRIRLLFARKTFRKTLTRWRGLQQVWNIASDASGEALSGVEDFGKWATRIAVTGIPKVTTDEPVATPNPNAIFTGVLGSETCVGEIE